MSDIPSYDIAIVGGGLAGASLACALSQLSVKVAVLEAFAFSDSAQPSFDDRSVALAYGSSLLLKDMGLWEVLSPLVEPISEIQISERGRLGLTRMSAQEENVPALGYVLENRLAGQAFAKQIESCEKLDWIAPANVYELEQRQDEVILSYQHGDNMRQLKTRLLVAADGGQSFTRSAVGVDVKTTDYGLSAIITNAQMQKPHHGVAYERFTNTGPLAFLPLSNFENSTRCSVVLTVKHDEVDGLMAMNESSFNRFLQERFGQRLGRIERTGQRVAYPVSLIEAARCTSHRTIILGNAAQSLNPVAGQGFNLALRDVATLLSVLNESDRKDVGSETVLKAYAEQRKQDRDSTIRFTDTLVKLFSNAVTPLSHARAGGLMLAEMFEPMRQQMVRQGMGLNGPRRVKGLGK